MAIFTAVTLGRANEAPPDSRAATIERQAVRSSSIASIGYDVRSKTLEIEFHSGVIYRYLAVPPAAFEALKNAESKGRHFTRYIRNKFEYHRVEPAPR